MVNLLTKSASDGDETGPACDKTLVSNPNLGLRPFPNPEAQCIIKLSPMTWVTDVSIPVSEGHRQELLQVPLG